MAAWLCALAVLFVYFRSGLWYRESMNRHVSPFELIELAGWILFGIVLPGIPFSRLLATRRPDSHR
jgi:hypothetical protein